MATIADLFIDQGSRWQAVIQPVVAWLPTLTGYSARGKVKNTRAPLSNVVLLFDFAPYMTVDVPNGLVLIDLPANVTALWSWETGVYDLELYDGNAAHDVRFLQGTIKVDKETT